MVAGDPEKISLEDRSKSGIPLTMEELEAFQKLSNTYHLGVDVEG